MVPSVLPQTIVSFPGQSVLKSSQVRAPTQHRAAGTPVLSVCDPSASPTEPARASGAHPVKLNSARVSAYPGRKRPSAPAPSLRRDKSNSSVVADTQAIRNDRLGTLVKGLCSAYAEAPSWEEFVTKFRGRSYLSPNLQEVDHPAIPLLREWRDHGVPVQTTSSEWTLEQKNECIRRGCHKSATEHSAFLREEFSEFIESKFWIVLPYDLVKDEPALQLSAAAVKEERDRKPRLISDHSWNWGWPSVNETTAPHSPPEAMQFGGALHRILTQVRHANPRFGPVRLCKHDIKDGFYRMFLAPSDCIRLSLVLPKYDGEPQLVAIPMSSTMGWVQSPPTFSSMSETVCDRANARFRRSPKSCPPHRLEEHAAKTDDLDPSCVPRPREPEDDSATKALMAVAPSPPPPEPEHLAPPSNIPFKSPVGGNDVFVDDFIQLGQGGRRRMRALRNHLLHAIDEILARPTLSEKHRNEAISLKKLLKGDGSWAIRKLVLGWIIDTLRQTLELPAHRKQTLADIFQRLAATHRVSAKEWQRILGKLRFVSVAVPGSAGLFCALQLALTKSKGNRVRINRSLRAHVDAFANLAASLCHRPTHLAEIIPQAPSYFGATDAAKAGMGGVFFDHTHQPYLWRLPFPPDIQADIVSTNNPAGSITNSDLEHCGLLGQVSVQADHFPVTYATIYNLSDNTPAVSRVRKGAVSSDGAAAHLCAYACAHQREHRYCHISSHISGPANAMADDTSRLQHLTDSALLHHFEQVYPQSKPWIQLHLGPEASSKLIWALRSRCPPGVSVPRPAEPSLPPLSLGPTSVPVSESPLPSVMSQTVMTRSATSLSLDSATASKDLSELMQWRKPFWRWGRGSPTWVNLIPESRLQAQTGTIPYWLLSSRPAVTKTLLPPAPTQPTSPSSITSTKSSTSTTRQMGPSTATPSTSSLSPSTGSSAQLSTWSPPIQMPGLRPSSSVTSPSPSMAAPTPAQQLL